MELQKVIEMIAPVAVWSFWILAVAVLVASLIRHPWAKAFVSIVANIGQDDGPIANSSVKPRATHYGAASF
jgi:hypothetical protein